MSLSTTIWDFCCSIKWSVIPAFILENTSWFCFNNVKSTIYGRSMSLVNGRAINFSMVVCYASWSKFLVYSITNNVDFLEMVVVIFCDCLPLKQGGLEPKTSLDKTCASLAYTSSWWTVFCILCCFTRSHVLSTFLFCAYQSS